MAAANEVPEMRNTAPGSTRSSTLTQGFEYFVLTKPQVSTNTSLRQRLFYRVNPRMNASNVHLLNAVGVP